MIGGQNANQCNPWSWFFLAVQSTSVSAFPDKMNADNVTSFVNRKLIEAKSHERLNNMGCSTDGVCTYIGNSVFLNVSFLNGKTGPYVAFVRVLDRTEKSTTVLAAVMSAMSGKSFTHCRNIVKNGINNAREGYSVTIDGIEYQFDPHGAGIVLSIVEQDM